MSKIARSLVSIAVLVWATGLLESKGALAAPQDQPERVEIGQEAPPFELESLDGELLSLRDLRGESPLILIFFRGTW